MKKIQKRYKKFDKITKKSYIGAMSKKKTLSLTAPFFILFLVLFSLEITATPYLEKQKAQSKCKEAFKEPYQESIFNFVKKPTPTKSLENLSEKKRLTKTDKILLAEGKKNILQYLQTSDINNLKKILTAYPQLKDLRWGYEEDPKFFAQIKNDHYKWSPKGWGLLQLAAYLKNSEVLDLFLQSDINLRTKKGRGSVSIEDNALHISIKRDFKKGVSLILTHQGLEKFGAIKSRFIDEKSLDKKTPWFLALQKDMANSDVLFSILIGQYNPSGYVESYVAGYGPQTGLSSAYATKSKVLSELGVRVLKFSKNYEFYRKKRIDNGYRGRTSPPKHH